MAVEMSANFSMNLNCLTVNSPKLLLVVVVVVDVVDGVVVVVEVIVVVVVVVVEVVVVACASVFVLIRKPLFFMNEKQNIKKCLDYFCYNFII